MVARRQKAARPREDAVAWGALTCRGGLFTPGCALPIRARKSDHPLLDRLHSSH